MKKELAPKYDHKKVEHYYEEWCKNGYFTAGDKSKDPYCIVIPPPNVTGKLHLGHAWDTTMQDMVARYKRMQGYDMLWLPGMDHAGIATQAKVDARLKEEGISRYDIGREAFLKRAWEWKDEYAGHIHEQWAKLGLSLDYSRERFTLDEGLSKAVRKVFVDLYKEGLIYQGERIINWDPQAKTALSNIEVIHKEIEGCMYYFKYEVQETGQQLVIATTRPETMFADQAIFVHPEDERYTDLIGKHAINPANGEALVIMADDYIDRDFGTAVMKCTPAHDPNDFALAKKYDLPMPVCMNPDGTMNAMAKQYEGMDRFACRKALVAQFEKDGVVDHIEKIMHQVGHSERTGVIVEPYLSKQWFVKMEPLAQEVLKNQSDEAEKIHFYPQRFEKTFRQWLENIEDWCISRQLWWGHRIPAWYHKETKEIYVGMSDPQDLENWVQDEDVLDTWFSSALWPFSTLGWPEATEDLNRYFPNDLLITGYDIIFFWVARMAFQTRYCMKARPFKDVLIHGLIRDEKGRKMSKSLGNGVDPMDVIDQYGLDSLRFFLTTNSTPGQDLRYSADKMESSWNFINKIWNASRFVLMQLDDDMEISDIDFTHASMIDKWIINRFNQVLKNVTENMEKYEDQNVANATKSTLTAILNGIVRLLHPFMPFVCEELFLSLPHEEASINLVKWPEPIAVSIDQKDAEGVSQLITMIEAVREIKTTYQLKPSTDIQVVITDAQDVIVPCAANINAILQKMCHATWVDQLPDEEMVVRSIRGGSLKVALASIVDVEAEIAKLSKEVQRLMQEIKRSEGMLNNPGFVQKAPQAKVDAEKAKLEDYRKQYEIAEKQLRAYEAKRG